MTVECGCADRWLPLCQKFWAKGQGVGNVWFVVAPVSVSAPAAPAPSAPAEGPATLPRTGGDGGASGWMVVLSLLLIVLGGALVGLRQGGRNV